MKHVYVVYMFDCWDTYPVYFASTWQRATRYIRIRRNPKKVNFRKCGVGNEWIEVCDDRNGDVMSYKIVKSKLDQLLKGE